MRRDNRPSLNVQPAANSTQPPCRTAAWRASTRVQQKPERRGERSPRPYRLARISTIRPDGVAHARVRAVSRLLSTLRWGTASLSGQGVGTSADAARMSACATSSPPNVCEKSGLKDRRGIRSFAGKEQFRVGGVFDRNKKHRPRSCQHMLGTQQEKGGGSAAPLRLKSQASRTKLEHVLQRELDHAGHVVLVQRETGGGRVEVG